MRGSRDTDLQKYRCPDRHGPHFMHGPLSLQVCMMNQCSDKWPSVWRRGTICASLVRGATVDDGH
jgi:hypothetical protein